MSFGRRLLHFILAVASFGMYKLEKKTAIGRRRAILAARRREVAKSRKELGDLAGSIRKAARQVNKLEEEKTSAERRLAEAMNSQDTNLARETNLLLQGPDGLMAALAQTQDDLRIMSEAYDQGRTLVLTAEADLRNAEQRGELIERRLESARSRHRLLAITSGMDGLGGLTAEMTRIDETMMGELDQLEGHAQVAELMTPEQAAMAADRRIAIADVNKAFEAEIKERLTPVTDT